jgi:hypothetical protein
MEYGQLTVETINDVAPRLIRFTEDLINRLRTCKIQVETTQVYLLNSTDHPIEVPCSGNGVSIEMNFDATLPIWAPEPRARLQVSFNHGRRYFYSERGKKAQNAKFRMSMVLKRFLSEIKIEERKRRIQAEKVRKAAKARQAFVKLGKSLDITPSEDPDVLQEGNLKIMCLPQTPTQVIVVLSVPHDQVVEIISKYLKT